MKILSKALAVTLITTSVGFAPKAKAMDLVLLPFAALSGDPNFFALYTTKYIMHYNPIFLLFLPFTLASSDIDKNNSLEQIGARLTEQGYDQSQINDYMRDLTTVIDPALRGQKFDSLEEVKAKVSGLELSETTRDILMIKK